MKKSYSMGFLALLEGVWVFAFSRFQVITDMFVEKCHLRAEGDFFAVLSKVPEWRVGWGLAYVVPLLAVITLACSVWKGKTLLGWLAVLSIHFVGSLLAILLTVQALITTSWALW